ncbi:hypothetical protein D9M71_766700 [compost metagenome]
MQGLDVGRIAADGPRRSVPCGIGQHLGQAWRLGDEVLQEGIQVGRRGGAGAADQRVERRLLQGLRLPRVRDQQR